MADIVPRRRRAERRASELLIAELEAISELAGELAVSSRTRDFDTGLTTDDIA